MLLSQAPITLAYATATARQLLPLARRQEQEDSNPSDQPQALFMGQIAKVRMVADDTDEMLVLPGVRKGWEG